MKCGGKKRQFFGSSLSVHEKYYLSESICRRIFGFADRFNISLMEKKVFLLDAMALIFRAYYAIIRNPRLTSKGKNTNAQFGFTNTLIELLTKERPTHLAVVFDTSAPTGRHTDFAEYKANRQETP